MFSQGKNKNNKDDESHYLYKLYKQSQEDEIAEEQRRIADRKRAFNERKSLMLGNKKKSSSLMGKNRLEKQFSSSSNV